MEVSTPVKSGKKVVSRNVVQLVLQHSSQKSKVAEKTSEKVQKFMAEYEQMVKTKEKKKEVIHYDSPVRTKRKEVELLTLQDLNRSMSRKGGKSKEKGRKRLEDAMIGVDRLTLLAKEREDRKKALKAKHLEEEQEQCNHHRPKINTGRAQSLVRSPVHTRPVVERDFDELVQERRKRWARQVQEDRRECSFSPSTSGFAGKRSVDDLMNWEDKRTTKIANDSIAQFTKECPFKPSLRRVKTDLNRSKSTQELSNRLYGLAMSREQNRKREEEAQYSNLFKPVINSNSDLIAKHIVRQPLYKVEVKKTDEVEYYKTERQEQFKVTSDALYSPEKRRNPSGTKQKKKEEPAEEIPLKKKKERVLKDLPAFTVNGKQLTGHDEEDIFAFALDQCNEDDYQAVDEEQWRKSKVLPKSASKPKSQEKKTSRKEQPKQPAAAAYEKTTEKKEAVEAERRYVFLKKLGEIEPYPRTGGMEQTI